jgi:hypothetical protein
MVGIGVPLEGREDIMVRIDPNFTLIFILNFLHLKKIIITAATPSPFGLSPTPSIPQ